MTDTLRTAIVSASHRPESQSARLVYTPEHLILRSVADLWEDGKDADASVSVPAMRWSSY
ncbi:hypothetical protein [Oceanobacter antarcticus]|uniref:Uncharacterized protein n=1 Tax=Oceanobacter antarcticus TaxID=3133425 RepID=A0ABW8NQK1_9GAMM